MQAARLLAPGDMRLVDVAKPVPGQRDVLVRVEAAGLCGSDRHMFRGEYPTALPVTLGHEFCGIVEAVGAEVEGLNVGDRVTADPNIACGQCEACRAGRVNLCVNLQAIGVTRDGGFAEWVAIPAGQAVVLPAALDAAAWGVLRAAGVLPPRARRGADQAGRYCRGAGWRCHRAADGATGPARRRDERDPLDAAGGTTRAGTCRQGATHAVDPAGGSGVAAIRDIAPSGVDVALECAGVPETLNDALAVAKPGGSVVLFGVMAKGRRMSIEPWDLLVREIRLEPAYLNPHTHRRAAEMIAAGALRLDPLISRVVGIDGVPDELGAEPRLGDVKVMVRPGV